MPWNWPTGNENQTLSKLNAMTTRAIRKPVRAKKRAKNYLICIDNSGYEASLESFKLYQIIPDGAAAAHGMVRVVDESGEDYVYSSERFLPIQVSDTLRRFLSTSSKKRGNGRP